MTGDRKSQTRAHWLETLARFKRDVEAPDVFQVTDSGLWDGRPSLGGVWVAHPMATSARRVRIYNVDNGAAVDGALFYGVVGRLGGGSALL